MSSIRPTAIYLIAPNCSNNDFTEVINYLKKTPEIKLFEFCGNGEKLNRTTISNDIKSNQLGKIILAGQDPGFYKDLFASELAKSGQQPEVEILNFREYGLEKKIDKERLIAAFVSLLYKIPLKKIVGNGSLPVNDQTLIIGGGIAGIQAALEIANANKKVYLVEKTATIGGHMAMFDKTFPTLDCAACILTPKMVEIGQHPDIELITYAEVKTVEGVPGNFKVKIHKKARKVNLNTCIGCGSCSARCPSETPSEFDAGVGLRNAIYIPFQQAVPNKYVVDANICRYINNPFEITALTIKELGKINEVPKELVEKLASLKKVKINSESDFEAKLTSTLGEENAKTYKDIIFKHSGECKNCIRFCPVNDCINLHEQDEEIEVTVGNIIVSTGFKPFDAKKAGQYGYGIYPNVLTSLELERLINASGPTEGKITLPSEDKNGNRVFAKDGQKPKSIAVIHCVGSRDINHNKYCSKVCCMYSLKLAHLVKEKLPESSVYEYFIDMRAYGKGYEEFYERIKNEGVNIIRGKTAKVEQKNGKLEIRGENMLENELIEQEIDMIVLSVGLEPSEDAKSLAETLGISISDTGWFNEASSDLDTVATNNQGITIAGVCQGPKDIPDTVAQASAAAAHVLQTIMKGNIKAEKKELKLEDIEKTLSELSQ